MLSNFGVELENCLIYLQFIWNIKQLLCVCVSLLICEWSNVKRRGFITTSTGQLEHTQTLFSLFRNNERITWYLVYRKSIIRFLFSLKKKKNLKRKKKIKSHCLKGNYTWLFLCFSFFCRNISFLCVQLKLDIVSPFESTQIDWVSLMHLAMLFKSMALLF